MAGRLMAADSWPDPTEIDWDGELADLPQMEILIEVAQRTSRGLVDQWYEIRAGETANFDDMPSDIGLDEKDRIGAIVVESFARAICTTVGVAFDELDNEQVERMTEEILGCITQGVGIGLAAREEETTQ